MSEINDFLTAHGYVPVPLRRSVVGHFHADGILDGRPVEVLVGTGASATAVASSVVETIGLRWKLLNDEEGGAGGVFSQYLVEGAVLPLGPLTTLVEGSGATDFTHVDTPLREKGVAAVEMVLGVDLFDAHAAVIDCATESLFLKPLAAEPEGGPSNHRALAFGNGCPPIPGSVPPCC